MGTPGTSRAQPRCGAPTVGAYPRRGVRGVLRRDLAAILCEGGESRSRTPGPLPVRISCRLIRLCRLAEHAGKDEREHPSAIHHPSPILLPGAPGLEPGSPRPAPVADPRCVDRASAG